MGEFEKGLDEAAAVAAKPKAKTPAEMLLRPSDFLDDAGPENDEIDAEPGTWDKAEETDQVAEGAGLRPWGIDNNGSR